MDTTILFYAVVLLVITLCGACACFWVTMFPDKKFFMRLVSAVGTALLVLILGGFSAALIVSSEHNSDRHVAEMRDMNNTIRHLRGTNEGLEKEVEWLKKQLDQERISSDDWFKAFKDVCKELDEMEAEKTAEPVDFFDTEISG